MIKRLKKGYLQWRCRRGTKELDVVLSQFLEEQYGSLTDAELVEFDTLLNSQDTELWYWLSGQQQPECGSLQTMIARINAKNK